MDDKIMCTTMDKIMKVVGCDYDFLLRQDLPLCPRCGDILVNYEVITILTGLWALEENALALLDLQQKIDQVVKKHLN